MQLSSAGNKAGEHSQQYKIINANQIETNYQNDIIQKYQCAGVAEELRKWREQIRITDIKKISRQCDQDRYSVAVLASGGGLDTIAAVRAGMAPVWGSDIDVTCRAMWTDLTGAPCYGDAFQLELATLRRPTVIKTGFPCPDYSGLGSGMGSKGATGGLYTQQTDVINELLPYVAIMEQSDGAATIDSGEAVKQISRQLSDTYYIHAAVIPVWIYGDPSNRQRTIIIAAHKDLGAVGYNFQFPVPHYSQQRYPIGADIAIPDEQVPSKYLLTGAPTEAYAWSEPVPGRIHHLGNYGEGAGHKEAPHPLQSWWGLPNTQLASNGGARRVMLSWRPGQPVNTTRLTTPRETAAIASLSNTYLQWARQFDPSDEHLQQCINNGVPLRTSTTIDQQVIDMLERGGVKPDVPASTIIHSEANRTYQQKLRDQQYEDEGMVVRSMMMDTGASSSLNYTDIEPAMSNTRRSMNRISVANNTSMDGSLDGSIQITVLNTADYENIQAANEFRFNTTTVSELRTELLSMDEPYRSGNWNLFIRQPGYQSGVSEMYRPAKDGLPEARVPIRYDYVGSGGWWVDYVPGKLTPDRAQLLIRHFNDTLDSNNLETAANLARNTYSVEAAERLWQTVAMHNAVKQVTLADSEGESPSILARHPDERQVKGVKAGLKPAKQKMPMTMFHKKHAHIGTDDGCFICRLVKGAMRRIYKKHTPYKETRPAYAWSMDMVTFSHRSLQGSKYAIVLRDLATGTMAVLPLYLKSDAPEAIELWATKQRINPDYSDLSTTHGYHAVSLIITDEPGEWSRRSAQWQAVLMRLKHIEIRHVTPETSREAGHAEKAVSMVEQCVKAILFEMNLPPNHWEVAARNAEFLLNRFPNVATDSTAPIDGDQARPLEMITRGRYSRRQIDRELSYFLQAGTPALVHDKAVKGSTLAPKVRWGVAWGMYREQVVFLCPITKSTFRSKSFVAFDLQHGVNYSQFLGLPAIESARKSLPLPGDTYDKVTVQLSSEQQAGMAGIPPAVRLQCASNEGVRTITVPIPNGTPINTEALRELGGSQQAAVRGAGGEGEQQGNAQQPAKQQLTADPECDGGVWKQLAAVGGLGQSGMDLDDNLSEQQPEQQPGSEAEAQLLWDSSPAQPSELMSARQHSPHNLTEGQQPYNAERDDKQADAERDDKQADAEYDANQYDDESDTSDNEWDDKLDQIAEILAEKDAITTGVNQSFTQICKQMQIPFELHEIYHKWLMSRQYNGYQRYNATDIPKHGYIEQGKHKQKAYLRPGLKMIPPHGADWRAMLKAKNLKRSELNRMRVIQANAAITKEIETTRHAIKSASSIADSLRQQPIANTTVTVHAAKKRQKAGDTAVGKQPPRSITKALRDADLTEAFKWLDSINAEWEGLSELGVLEHGYTRAQLHQEGITSNPIPFSVCLTYKYDKDGNINRYKTRMALAGHPGNMKQGIHYDKTYSSTPIQHTIKVMQAIMVSLKLKRLTFDIKMAYCKADIPEEYKIAVRYPDGLRRFQPETGEELFMILRRNLYGHPAAGRLWEKERNKVLNELFNCGPWSIKRSRKDPCLYLVKHTSEGRVRRAWAMIWTDDVDLIGDDDHILQAIYKIINEKWESKLTDSSFMLGVRREITYNGNEMAVELTMTAFIDAMAEAFRDHLHKRKVSTPLPEGLFLHKRTDTPMNETAAVMERGYQRLVGMLLWAARGVYPECLLGTSMLGRLMAAPTEEAWTAACHMMTYMTQHRTQGIRFTSSGNNAPIAFSDSSNKPDPTDGKCQYGYSVQWQGGPVIACSKKLSHVGLSASHNEWMALHFTNRHVMWLRELLTEMELGEVVEQPTCVKGDNRAANLLCTEDIVTCGNQFLQLPFYFNKEVVESGAVVVSYVPTADNLADLFTKAVSKQVLTRLLPRLIGLEEDVAEDEAPIDHADQRHLQ